jgi:hypothetical protein
MREDEDDFTKRIYNFFYEENGASFARLTGQQAIFCHIDDLNHKLSQLF